MKPTALRSLITLLLLAAALAGALWLADALERGAPLLQRPRDAASLEGAGPIFSPPGGAYDRSLLVGIQPSHPRGQVVFATGGHVPTLTVGTLYERPLLLDADAPGVTVVRAREVVAGLAGPVASASYVVGVERTLPILSIATDPPDLRDAERGIFANTWRRGQEWERPVHVTYIAGDQRFEIPAGLRVHGSERFDAPKQSLRLYFRNEYAAARLEQPLFPDHPYQEVQSYKRLLLQAGERSGRWTLLEEQLLSDVAAEVGGRATQGHFVLLFLNGEPWGIYRLSERIDRFFLADNFGIRSADLIRGGNVAEGDAEHWDALLDWLATHDLADAANFAYVETQIDVDDFTDYTILQTYFGFPADRFSAARPRVAGGRWFWLYGGWREGWMPGADPEMTLLAPADDAGDLALLLHKLLENPDYRARFAGRVADLLNTTLAPTAMEARVGRLAAQLRPDVAYETARWPAPTDWERNVAALRDVAWQRPDLLRQQVASQLGLQGTANLTFDVSPEDGGTVFVNGLPAPSSPWSGIYFLDTVVQVIAVPAPGYAFDGWESVPVEVSSRHTPTLPHPHTPLLTVSVDGPRTLMARFVPVPADDPALRPNDVIINEYWINDDGTRYASIGDRPIEGDWLELLVTRPRTVDLRGWRITDNDTKSGTGEGSIIFPRLDALAAVPRGTVILIVVTASNANTAYFGQGDLDPGDGQMVLYVGNGNLDVTTDPGFGIGTGDDNVVLLAPGPSPAFADDVGVDFVAEGDEVTPLSFGVLADGVVFDAPFRGLGADDGALFTGAANNDDGAVGWIVDPAADQSGDGIRLDSTNVLTPGALNRRQRGVSFQAAVPWLLLVGLTGAAIAVYLRARRDQSSRKTTGK